MSVHCADSFKFNQVRSVKLPRSAAYIYNNLIQYNDTVNNVSYYAIIHGFEVWIMKHSELESVTIRNKKEPSVELRKVLYDKLSSVSCVAWCEINATVTFIIGTESGIIHVYDFEAKKILYSHDINVDRNNPFNPSINCIDCNHHNMLFVALSSGALLSFNIDDSGITNKKQIYQCPNNEAINCISRVDKNNKIYIGCGDGSVIQYNFLSDDIDVLIDASNVNRICDEQNMDESEAQNNNENEYTHHKYVNNCGSCVCISSCDEFIVAGYSSGHIKIVQKSELSFVIKQIAMHRRMVTSVAILEDMCLIGTVSEDGYFHIIRNTTSSLEVIRSGSFENCILIGIKFVKSPHHSLYDPKHSDRMVLMTAYDRNRVVFV